MFQIDVERYGREGVLFPIPVLSEAEMKYFRTQVEDLEDHLGGRPKPADLRQPQLFHRWAYDLAIHPAVLDVVEQIVGPNILVHSVSIFSKHPRTADYVSWHQDGHYWGLDAPRLTTAWIALTDSNPENGCMRVVPGTHVEDWLPHASHPANKDNMLTTGLEVAVDVAESDAVDVTLAAGEMSLHHVNIIHGSNPNKSDDKRIGIGVRYVACEVRQSTDHHDVILARGRDDHHHYSILRQPPSPSATIEESLRAQAEFARRQMAAWRATAENRETNQPARSN